MPTRFIKLTDSVFDQREIENLQTCLDSGWVTQGPFVDRFEEMICKAQGVKHALAVTSCTAGLHISVQALGLGPDDEVIVPAFTWVTTANAAEYSGAKAVFVDIDPLTFNIDPTAIEAAVTSRTKAIIAVHLFGLAAPMDAIRAIANKHDLFVIEDAACAIGTHYRGQPVGALGDIGCFSFHPRKAVTTGEGGAVTTNNEELAEHIDAMRNHGSIGPPPQEANNRQPWTMARFAMLGFNYRMSDIQAAVGVAQMEKLESIVNQRVARAGRYTALLKDKFGDIGLPGDPDSPPGHSYQSYVIRVLDGGRTRRNAIMLALQKQGIETRPGTHAVHRLEYYREKYDLRTEDYPNAASCEGLTITLPLSPRMSDEDQDWVVGQLQQALAKKAR